MSGKVFYCEVIMRKKLVYICLPFLLLLTGCVDFNLPLSMFVWLRDTVAVSAEGKVALTIEEEIYLTDLSGSYFERITENEYLNGSPVWSADGKRLLYTEEAADVWQLKLYVPQERQHSVILQEMDQIVMPAFSAGAEMISYLVVPEDSGLQGTLNIYEKESSRIYPLLQDVYLDYEWFPATQEIAAIIVSRYLDSDQTAFQGMLIVKDIASLAERVIFNGYFLSADSSMAVTGGGRSLIFSASADQLDMESADLYEKLTLFVYNLSEDTLSKWHGLSGYDYRLPGAVSSSLNGWLLAKAQGSEEGWAGQLYLVKDKQKKAIPGWPLWFGSPMLVYLDIESGNEMVANLDTGERIDLQEKFTEISGEL